MEAIELPSLPDRPADGHKGTFGKVMLIGGSTGMAGSIGLAGIAALRTGSGLVTLAIPDCILPTVAAYEPSYLTMPLSSDDHGRISAATLAHLESNCEKMDAIGIGPGLNRSNDLDDIVARVYRKCEMPMVVDADALNSLALNSTQLSAHAGPRVLTPHPGEFSRLTGMSIAEIQADREGSAARFARQHSLIVVLKGRGTIVTDGESLAINETGNSGMGTGGAGDVLTGIITSLLGQGIDALKAARLGVYCHGLAGDIAARVHSRRGLIASDLVTVLGEVWHQMGES